ncbi:MAG: DUF4255 domain-containing protein [Nitrososphaerota archaeon]|jgi:hypothetical protein|nr:DUF4255 domain-containing protein [Nitrososphaerota archaeon]
MSDYRAIATVTAVIRDILRESQQKTAEGNTVDVSTSSPAAIKTLITKDNDILGLFLYQVTPNAACRNLDLPTRNQSGQPMVKPTLALDLHYLLSASSINELKAQLMLSSAMIALHENAIIPKQKINETILLNTDLKPVGEDFLSKSNLINQIESLKISIQLLTIDELTKLWSSFAQTEYRLSVAYHVSVIFIESTLEPTPSLPVSKRQILAIPIKQPIIEKIEPQIMAYNSDNLDDRKLIITGRNLDSDKVLVAIGDKEIEVVDKKAISENQLRVTVPSDTLAGITRVQVLQKIQFETDEQGHKGYASNVAAFVLAPNLKKITQTPLKHGEDLVIVFEPGIAKTQTAQILIGDYVVAVNLSTQNSAVTYPLESLTVTIPPRIPAGTYPVRLRINNADSPLRDDNKQTITITNHP